MPSPEGIEITRPFSSDVLALVENYQTSRPGYLGAAACVLGSGVPHSDIIAALQLPSETQVAYEPLTDQSLTDYFTPGPHQLVLHVEVGGIDLSNVFGDIPHFLILTVRPEHGT